MSRKILVGPLSNVVTGQSLAFVQLVNYYTNSVVVNTNTMGKNIFTQLIITVFVVLKSVFFLYFSKVKSIYISASRSPIGLIRDSLIIHIAKIRNLHVVVHIHGADFQSGLDKAEVFGSFIKSAYAKVDKLIVLSEGMGNDFNCLNIKEKVIIPNFFDDRLLSDGPKDFKAGSEPLQILFLSNIIYSKGITFLVDAVEMLNKQGYNVKLNIAGESVSDGFRHRVEMKSFIENVSLKNIQYHGGVAFDGKSKLLSENHVICLPTFYPTEAQPICLIEGMASGLTVLTTEHNYMRDFVSESNGLIIEPESSESIYNAIKYIVDNPSIVQGFSMFNFHYANKMFNLKSHLEKVDQCLI